MKLHYFHASWFAHGLKRNNWLSNVPWSTCTKLSNMLNTTFCATILLWWAGYIPVNFDRVCWGGLVCVYFSPAGSFVLGIFSSSLWLKCFSFPPFWFYICHLHSDFFLLAVQFGWSTYLLFLLASYIMQMSVSTVSIMLHRERLSTKDGTLYHIHLGQFVVLCTSVCHYLK